MRNLALSKKNLFFFRVKILFIFVMLAITPALNCAAKNIDALSLATINNSLSIFLQQAFQYGNIMLFPVLFIAGLLMNFTPCVYPMIPLTISSISQFSKKNAAGKNKYPILASIIYVFAMAVTYACLGVFAGLSGNIFGSQFLSPVFAILIASLMFACGLSMLGIFNLSSVQSFATRIHLTKDKPIISLAIMGAVSALVSAPCTGPILSMILLLIMQGKDPVFGFLYMLIFACGFGMPYVILGIISQKIIKIPKLPFIVNIIELFFAAFMFALGVYFLKFILQDNFLFKFLYLAPSYFSVIFCIVASIIAIILGNNFYVIRKLCRAFAFLCLFFLCLWLSLASMHAFNSFDPIKAEKIKAIDTQIIWRTDYHAAIKLAKAEHKPILIDIWANWCAACLKMESSTWLDINLIKKINNQYIPIKLNYSKPSILVDTLINRWKIVGLPAVIIFDRDTYYSSAKPRKIFQGMVSAQSMLHELCSF